MRHPIMCHLQHPPNCIGICDLPNNCESLLMKLSEFIGRELGRGMGFSSQVGRGHVRWSFTRAFQPAGICTGNGNSNIRMRCPAKAVNRQASTSPPEGIHVSRSRIHH
jgi:hypothetical protein